MFESYMRYQYADPRGRRQLTFSALIAGALTLSTITLALATSKMEITRVDAPGMDTLLFQLGMESMTPPPPPPPPPPPAGGDANDDDSKEVRDPTPDTPPEEVIDRTPAVRRQSSGVRGGDVQGVPDGLIGGKVGGLPKGIPCGVHCGVLTPKSDPIVKPPAAEPPVPLQSVMARGIYTPNPDSRLFASRADRRPCTNRTHFCVNPDGHVSEVRTARSCGDADVDRICRDTVKTWRFKAATVAGSARRTCSSVEFSLTFKE